ncbi:MAG: hypothetical protein OEY22_00960 [Candidatus Bathyarchaeota archaeon]|nr:hypothetical protein [Candidatus Bathyarchaeota archaeon]MDH5787750.1 hypothetical protein [Candidatus Bathyarchaeota archaeon]
MKLLVVGLAGVIIACLIFTAVVALPWSEIVEYFSPGVSPDIPTFPIGDNSMIMVNLSISNFTEPLGPGSEANVTVSVTSRKEMSNARVQIELSPIYIGQGIWPNVTWTPIGSQGIDLTDGNLTWTITLPANTSVGTNIKIKATEVGFGVITATVIWWETSSTFYKSEASLYVQILEDKIVVYNNPETIILP